MRRRVEGIEEGKERQGKGRRELKQKGTVNFEVDNYYFYIKSNLGFCNLKI